MAADEATQFSAIKTDAPESAPANEAPESAPAGDARVNDDVVAMPEPGSQKENKTFCMCARYVL